MALRLEICDEFRATLAEVDALIDAARYREADHLQYAAFNKAALLLLTGKFENFAESIAEEFLFALNGLQPKASAIPSIVRLHHTFAAVKKLDTMRSPDRHEEAIRIISEVGKLWISDGPVAHLNVDCKLAFGRHGENELRRLFIPLGIEDVFREVAVYHPGETMGQEGDGTSAVDFSGVFNSVTNIRNNILHQDASPSLTSAGVWEYRQLFEAFAIGLETLLAARFDEIQQRCA